MSHRVSPLFNVQEKAVSLPSAAIELPPFLVQICFWSNAVNGKSTMIGDDA
jgi:hypothetical protein